MPLIRCTNVFSKGGYPVKLISKVQEQLDNEKMFAFLYDCKILKAAILKFCNRSSTNYGIMCLLAVAFTTIEERENSVFTELKYADNHGDVTVNVVLLKHSIQHRHSWCSG